MKRDQIHDLAALIHVQCPHLQVVECFALSVAIYQWLKDASSTPVNPILSLWRGIAGMGRMGAGREEV